MNRTPFSMLIFLLTILTFAEGCSSKKEKDMVYFKGGDIVMGTNIGFPTEYPEHEVNVKPFFLDIHPVTVKQFRVFVNQTGYKTEAEKFGDAGVLNMKTKAWELVKGACWHHPLGPNAPASAEDHPVTQVSWNDARAFSTWEGKRLPSEKEWEFAARNGISHGNRYSWGNNLTTPSGKFMANVWEGAFPDTNTVADGFLYTNPVGYFGINPNGLTDMGGNVWEWCNDVYDMYPGNNSDFKVDTIDKVLKGGSFLCDSNVCHGYRVAARQHCTKETGLFHTGFRCAKDAN